MCLITLPNSDNILCFKRSDYLMKRIISLLSVLFVCVLICTGCSVKKSSQITKSDFEKTLYPKDVVGELIIENEAANKEKSAFYTNEHFGIKAEFNPDLNVRKGIENDGEPTSATQELSANNTDNSFQHTIAIYTRASLNEGFKYASADDISSAYMKGLSSGMGGEVIKEIYQEEYSLMGVKQKAYSADVKLKRNDTGEEYTAHVSLITLEVDLYLCDLLTISTSSEETQQFLSETYSNLE